MAWFTGKMPKQFKYPIEKARIVCLVKAIETTKSGFKHWSAEKGREATRLMMSESTDTRNASKLIEQRAALVYAKVSKEAPSLRTLAWRRGMGLFIAMMLILGAYLAGAFGERLLSTSTEINLFSPLLLLVFGWSLVFYALLALLGLGSLVRRRHMELPLRTPLAKLSGGLFAPKLISSALRREFLAIWAPAVLRIAQFRMARVLHWAFLAFCAGIISSVAVRGIGNGAYLIGWELPGLNNAPEQVRQILDLLFGWIPGFLNLAALPDVDTVAAMRLDRLAMSPGSAPSISSASSWLPRLLLLFSAVVLIPRLLLIIWDTLAIKLLSARVAIPCDAYFEAILAEDPASPAEEAVQPEASGAASEAAGAGRGASEQPAQEPPA